MVKFEPQTSLVLPSIYTRCRTATWSAQGKVCPLWASPATVGGTCNPSAFAVLRLMTNSNLGRLHHRQLGGLGALENFACVYPALAISIGEITSIAHQAAGFSELSQ